MESRESYSLGRIEELHEHLLFQADAGTPLDYEIRIDHLIVVRRTNDHLKFYEFEPQLKDSSCNLYVVIFKGASRKSDKFCFTLRETEEQQSFQYQLQQAIKLEKEAMLIRMEMEYLQKKVRDQKQTIKDLRRTIEKSETGSAGLTNILKELSTSPLVKGFVTEKITNADPAALGALPNEEIANVIQHYRNDLGEETFQELLGTMLAMAQSPALIPKVRTFITAQKDKS